MMIPCNYEINVAKENDARKNRWSPRGLEHYCRIELGDVMPEVAKEKFLELKQMFPEDKFELTLYQVTCGGKEVEV